MTTYDISLTISPDIPVWPGDPAVSITRSSSMEAGDVCNVTRMDLGVHTGTHVDAPRHFVKNGAGVEDLSLDALVGPCWVVHLPDVDVVTDEVLENAELPERVQRVLFRTRNSEMWTQEKPTFDESYVALGPDAAEYLVRRGVKLIGVDGLSVAPFNAQVPTHELLLSSGVVVLEGINLFHVPAGRYTLYCLPLKILGSDGSPARAILTTS